MRGRESRAFPAEGSSFFCIDVGLASPEAQRGKSLPAMWETQVRSLGREDPLEKEVATHSSTPAWRIPCTEEPGGLQSTESPRVRHNWATIHTGLLGVGKEVMGKKRIATSLFPVLLIPSLVPAGREKNQAEAFGGLKKVSDWSVVSNVQ